MIIYSEILKKEFDTVEACEKAEAEYKAEQEKINEEKKVMKEKRAARAKEIDEAFKEIRVAQDKYNNLVKKFIKDYGSYHSTYTSNDDIPDVFELLKPFWCIQRIYQLGLHYVVLFYYAKFFLFLIYSQNFTNIQFFGIIKL